MDEQFIDIDYLRQLMELFDASTASEIRLEKGGVEIRLSKASKAEAGAPAIAYHAVPAPVPAAAPSVSAAAPEPTAAPAVDAPSDSQLHTIWSPIVGTFYQAANPNAKPYVEVGSHVVPGSVLCIIEAMKLMNEIESDVAGVVVEILVENGQPVEYGQPLFKIKLD